MQSISGTRIHLIGEELWVLKIDLVNLCDLMHQKMARKRFFSRSQKLILFNYSEHIKKYLNRYFFLGVVIYLNSDIGHYC